MTVEPLPADVPAGDVAFVDGVVPALAAGDYQVEVTDHVEVPDTAHPGPYLYEHARRLRVAGPHLGLDPGDVIAVHPPNGTQSDWSSTLPHVVLGRRTLPWEIDVGGRRDGPAVTPWLALLLLTPDEVRRPADAGAIGPTGTRVVALGDYLAPGPGVLGPDLPPGVAARWAAEHPGRSCTVVDVDAAAFAAVAPAVAELADLAHAREAGTGAQEVAAATADGWCAVVVGNRLPAGSATGVYLAHLVSVEGFTAHLPGGAPLPAGTAAVRLLSLASWSFNSLTGTGSFAGRMAAVDVGALRLPPELVADRSTTEGQLVAAAVGAGYTGLAYGTRLGEETVGWYRGPLVPVDAPPVGQVPTYETAEAALAYDQQLGMFDVSYAVAWQLGRLTALADRSFVASLLRWVRSNASTVHLLVERLGRAGAGGPLDLPDDVGELLEPDLLRRRAQRWLASGLAAGLAPADPAVTPLLGPATDPAGLAAHAHRVPGRAARGRPPAPAPRRAAVATSAPVARPRRHVAAQALLGGAAGRAALAATVTRYPDDVVAWLGRLALLEGVPFDHLVPDARMLPSESIRFFAVDGAWTGAAIDGAVSVVHLGGHDTGVLRSVRPSLHGAAADGARRRRPARRAGDGDRPAPPASHRSGDGTGPWTGFVLRSAVVADVPGLTVVAHPDAAGREPALPVLRLDRVTPGVLVAVFDGVVRRVELGRPAHGLAFGVEPGPGGHRVYLRGLGDGIDAGRQPAGDPSVDVPLRPGGTVVDVAALHAAVVQGLAAAYGSRPAPPLHAGGVALQLVAGAERQAFSAAAPPATAAGRPRADRAPAPRPVTVTELWDEIRRAGG